MTEIELNALLLEAFPELKVEFEEYTSWQDGLETGCFLVYEDLLLPLFKRALAKQNSQLLKRAGRFIDELLSSKDEYAVNVATIGLLEGLKSGKCDGIRDYLGPKALEEYDSLTY